MLATKVMSMGTRRAGLPIAQVEYLNSARDWLNMGLKDLVARRTWMWRYKEGTLTTVASQRQYALASDVLYTLKGSWVHETDDSPMLMADVRDLDVADPDESTTGGSRFAAVVGISGTTGLWQVGLADTPDTSSETIRYRYIIKAIELNDDGNDDATDLDLTYPDWVQHALHLYVSAFLKGENGDESGQITDLQLYENQIVKMELVDSKAAGQDRVILSGDPEMVGVEFRVLSLDVGV